MSLQKVEIRVGERKVRELEERVKFLREVYVKDAKEEKEKLAKELKEAKDKLDKIQVNQRC